MEPIPFLVAKNGSVVRSDENAAIDTKRAGRVSAVMRYAGFRFLRRFTAMAAVAQVAPRCLLAGRYTSDSVCIADHPAADRDLAHRAVAGSEAGCLIDVERCLQAAYPTIQDAATPWHVWYER